MRKQDNLITDLVKLDKELAEIKTRQLSGSGNIFGYINETNDTWDIDWTVASVGIMGFAQARVNATFTSDRQVSAFTALSADVFADSNRYTTENDPFIYQAFDLQADPDIATAQFKQTSTYIIQAGLGKRIQMKFRANSTDTGTLNIAFVIEVGS
jgi:hypothetical protein